MFTFLAVLVVLLVALIGALALFGYGCGQLLPGAERPRSHAPLRGVAALAGAAALALYGWGLLGVAGAVMTAEDGGADSSPVIPCRTGDPGHDVGIVDYSVMYVPLGFVCETDDGDTYATDDVPGYVNPAAALFGLTGVTGVALVGFRRSSSAAAG